MALRQQLAAMQRAMPKVETIPFVFGAWIGRGRVPSPISTGPSTAPENHHASRYSPHCNIAVPARDVAVAVCVGAEGSSHRWRSVAESQLTDAAKQGIRDLLDTETDPRVTSLRTPRSGPTPIKGDRPETETLAFRRHPDHRSESAEQRLRPVA